MKLFTILFLFILSLNLNAQSADLELASRMDQYLKQWEEKGFSGSILAAKNGKVIHTSGYGYADRENKIRNESSTIFDIGSITKQFTAAAILKLEMMGRLAVEDNLEKYFGNIPADKKGITIHQLLTHSAGFTGSIGDDYAAITDDDYLVQALKSKLLFAPGTAYQYSNVGYSILTVIIEQVSAQPYESFLQKEFFGPVKMTKTGYQIPNYEASEIAIGYRRNKPWGRPNEKSWAADGPYLHLKGNGGILSNVEDMYKWHQALLGDDILSEAAKQKMYTKQIEEGEDANSYYGYGWAIFPTPRNTELIAHNGGNGIFFADFWRYLDEKITVIFMTNSASRKYEGIVSELAKMLRENDYTPTVPDQEDTDENDEEEMKAIVNELFELFKTGDNESYRQFLMSDATVEFQNVVPMETHLEMFEKIKSKIADGQIQDGNIEDGEVILTIKNKSESFNMMMGVEKDSEGNMKVSGVMVPPS